MDTRAPLIASLLVLAGMAAMSLWAGAEIPAGAHIATHFTFSGKPNGYMVKTWALWFSPALAAVLTVLFACSKMLYGRTRESGGEAMIAAWLGLVMLLAVVHALILLRARGIVLDVSGNVVFAVALLFTVVGNFMGKLAPNGLAGVRTYWTYRSDYSWEKTNRLAGRIAVATGLLTIAALALFGTHWGRIALFTGIGVLVAVSVPASYVYWRDDPEHQR